MRDRGETKSEKIKLARRAQNAEARTSLHARRFQRIRCNVGIVATMGMVALRALPEMVLESPDSITDLVARSLPPHDW